jgi:intracellular septation protein A
MGSDGWGRVACITEFSSVTAANLTFVIKKRICAGFGGESSIDYKRQVRGLVYRILLCFFAMSIKTILKALLPGLIPLLVFVAADALFGEVVGLAVGLAVGIGEFLFTLIKNRRADPFVAADMILLAIAGGLSLVLRNEIFFKLKPAAIEAVLAVFLAVLLALPASFLRGWLSSQLRGIALPDSSLPVMKRSLSFMLGVLVVHVALTVWAATSLSNAAWGFISGGLLYILFGVLALAQFLSARIKGRGGHRLQLPL